MVVPVEFADDSSVALTHHSVPVGSPDSVNVATGVCSADDRERPRALVGDEDISTQRVKCHSEWIRAHINGT